MRIARLHSIWGSVEWRLTKQGIEVDGQIPRTRGYPATVSRIWNSYKVEILGAAQEFNVPVELIIATIATESGGNASALRKEPGYKSDRSTPHRISAGLMQTLISTARMWRSDIVRADLLQPAGSIYAGTSYIAFQRKHTSFDPPLVAAAYNAGGVYKQTGASNRWKTRQYPIGTGKHADRFVQWYNDVFALFELEGYAHAAPSQYVDMRGSGLATDRAKVEKDLTGKSRTIEGAKSSTFWAKLQAFFGAIFGVPAAGATVIDIVTDTKQKTQTIGTTFGLDNNLIFAVLGAVAIGTAIMIWYNNRKVVKARVEDSISGKNVDL